MMITISVAQINGTTEATQQAPTYTEIRLLQEQIRAQTAQQETLISTMRRDLGSIQSSLRPSTFTRISRLATLGLATYGAYNLCLDYLKSSYKPQVDAKLKQAQALVNLIFPESSDKKTTDQ